MTNSRGKEMKKQSVNGKDINYMHLSFYRTNIPRPESLALCFGRLVRLLFVMMTTMLSVPLISQEANPATIPTKPPAPVASPAKPEDAEIVDARKKAILLHEVYSTTLGVIHHHYFHREKSVIPAKAMEDVFEEMAGTSGTMANWISVNTKAMNIDHRPRTEFERTAADEITEGKESYELVGKHFYRRAARIPLTTNCVGCHDGLFATANKNPSWAALVISIPLTGKK